MQGRQPKLCAFFAEGRCKYGDRCRNVHAVSQRLPVAAPGGRTAATTTVGSSSTASVTLACRFFAAGCCTKGDACPFSHTVVPSAERLVCQFFLRGHCRFGDKCVDRHDINKDTALKMECNVCLESVVMKKARFGILPSCDHVFCLECIKRWRKDSEANETATHGCPVCRKQSLFVMPSVAFVTGEAKEKAIRAYLHALNDKPCRFYSRKQHCPFGRECFYGHFSRKGKRMDKSKEHRPQLRQRRDSALLFELDGSGDFLAILEELMDGRIDYLEAAGYFSSEYGSDSESDFDYSDDEFD